VNLEDSLFAGAVIERIGKHFDIKCDSSRMVQNLYKSARGDLSEFMKQNDATHYHRLSNFGLEKDIRYCLAAEGANVLPKFVGDRLVIG
jgi:2-phosphosulfolactate phosphatase